MKKTNNAIANISKKANKQFDKATKAVGMNYFERRKFKKTCKNFGYDVAVNVTSTLVLDTVGLIAHGTGVAVGATYMGIKNGVSKIAGAVSDKVEDVKTQHDIKKQAKKQAAADIEEKIEEIAEEVAEAIEEFDAATEEVATED